jgi:hypothetical protein
MEPLMAMLRRIFVHLLFIEHLSAQPKADRFAVTVMRRDLPLCLSARAKQNDCRASGGFIVRYAAGE